VSKLGPIYRVQDETYQADNCLPLVEAARRGDVRLHAVVRGHYPGKPLPHDVLPGVRALGFWDAEVEQSWGLAWHRNEGIEFTFLENGTIAFSVDDRQCSLRPDDLTITRPWQLHRVGDPNVGPGRLHYLILDVGVRRPNQPWKWPPWVLLSQSDLDAMTTILRHSERPVWKGSASLRRCVQAIADAIESDRNGSSSSRLAVRLNEYFLLLFDLLTRKKLVLDERLSSSPRTVELFLSDIKNNSEQLTLEWTVGGMARSCGLGVTQFIYHVKQLTNMTPGHYLNRCRLDAAVQLLRQDTGTTVTDVAQKCGFSTSQYFATAFSRRFGTSPRSFRERLRETSRKQVQDDPSAHHDQ